MRARADQLVPARGSILKDNARSFAAAVRRSNRAAPRSRTSPVPHPGRATRPDRPSRLATPQAQMPAEQQHDRLACRATGQVTLSIARRSVTCRHPNRAPRQTRRRFARLRVPVRCPTSSEDPTPNRGRRCCRIIRASYRQDTHAVCRHRSVRGSSSLPLINIAPCTYRLVRARMDPDTCCPGITGALASARVQVGCRPNTVYLVTGDPHSRAQDR